MEFVKLVEPRETWVKKFTKFLTLKSLDEEKFFLQNAVEQCKIMKYFWECLRKKL